MLLGLALEAFFRGLFLKNELGLGYVMAADGSREYYVSGKTQSRGFDWSHIAAGTAGYAAGSGLDMDDDWLWRQHHDDDYYHYYSDSDDYDDKKRSYFDDCDSFNGGFDSCSTFNNDDNFGSDCGFDDNFGFSDFGSGFDDGFGCDSSFDHSYDSSGSFDSDW